MEFRRISVRRDIRTKVYMQSGGRCIYCGDYLTGGWNVDHLIPICQGGRNNIENLGASCTRCNTLKGGLDINQFRSKLKLDAVRRKNHVLDKYLTQRLEIYMDDKQKDEIYGLLVDFDKYIMDSIEIKFFFERH